MLPRYFVALCLLCGTISANAQDALNQYIFKKNWSPVPDHATEIVPGSIIEVPLDGIGSYEVLSLNEQQKAAKLDSGGGMWDATEGARATGVDAGVAGLSQILGGIGLAGGFANNSTIAATKITWQSFKLANGERERLLKDRNGDTYKYIRANYDGSKAAYYLVTQVASSQSAEVRSNREIGAFASVGSADAGSCTSPTSPPPIAEKPATAGALKAEIDKLGLDTAATPKGKLRICHGGPDHVTFDSPGLLPIAMKVELITSRGDDDATGTVDTTFGARPLPTWDNRKLASVSRDSIGRAYHGGLVRHIPFVH